MYMRILDQIRKNHGLEHATVAILLAQNHEIRAIAGNAMHDGFFIFADLDTVALRSASEEALWRMQNGESHLAVSPFCGTNIVVGAGLTSIAAILSIKAARNLPRSIPRVLSNSMLALLLAKPLGNWVQAKYSTSSKVEKMQIGEIRQYKIGNFVVHKITTVFQD